MRQPSPLEAWPRSDDLYRASTTFKAVAFHFHTLSYCFSRRKEEQEEQKEDHPSLVNYHPTWQPTAHMPMPGQLSEP